ncbi:hypothetical protein NDK50_26620 [Paraburkholderia bryophila]|uniref:hypothetical protein n=1 Tax=Paraburkholderia bryophila TaxID=420952 RepID=UPI00234B9370|nr:hypothetical protein [Paraburkholderia bryophila]WCM24389.1 hypothetical protein NDK50_26620 [Paraburkholderia bryophila]
MLIPHSAIAPVHAIETAAQAVSKAGTATAGAVPQVAPATDEAAAKFKALMDHAKLGADAGVNAHPHDSALAKIVAQQDGVVGDIAQDIERFQKDAPALSPTEFAARSVDLQFKMAEMMTTIEMGVGFAQGGKGAVQNLMKNQ